MELAPRTEESALDMTAALTAPRPTKETKPGVRYCSTMGRTMLACSGAILPSTQFVALLLQKPVSSQAGKH